MRNFLIILLSVVSFVVKAQTFSQHFSTTAPAGWSSTSNTWILNYNGASTSNYNTTYDATTYSARFPSAATDNSVYLYIPTTFVAGERYLISFYTKRTCSVSVLANETANQTTPLYNSTLTNTNCSSNFNIWYNWTFYYKSTYSGNGYIQIKINTVYGGPTSVYLDDISMSNVTGLPIELVSFTGEAHSEFNKLEWSTMTEVNNFYFLVEKTYDGSSYSEVATLSGAGNSKRQLYYTTYDYEVSSEICYYRLKQVDFDGVYTYSDLISIRGIRTKGMIIKVVNIYGIEVDINAKGLVILIYDDNSVVKVFN